MNLGYACINMTLSGQKPKVTTNRSMIKKTFKEKGLDYAGELGMLNAADLSKILKWNVSNIPNNMAQSTALIASAITLGEEHNFSFLNICWLEAPAAEQR